MPAARVTPDSVAEPFAIVATPSVELPFRNVAVPVAVDGVTVAVSAMGWFAVAGFGLADKATVACAEVMVRLKGGATA